MSLTSYRTAPSRDALFWAFGPFRLFPFWGLAVVVAPSGVRWGFVSSLRDTFCVSDFTRFGGDLLSHVLRRSTIGATALNGRVRDGTGCFARAMTTKPGKIRDTFMKSYRPEGYLRTGVTSRLSLGWCIPSHVHCVFVYAFDFVSSLVVTGSNQAYRAISTGQLNALLRLHLRPIDVVVYHGPQGYLVLRGASRLDAFSGYPVRT